MQKWEYLQVYDVMLSPSGKRMISLNGNREEHPGVLTVVCDLGAQGWELVTVDSGCFYFKRPKP
jgi:hypothetical protein